MNPASGGKGSTIYSGKLISRESDYNWNKNEKKKASNGSAEETPPQKREVKRNIG